MHPDIAKSLVAYRREELVRQTAAGRRRAGPRFPRWRVSWTRTVLAPAAAPAATGGNRTDHGGRRGSSLVIIISAYRSA